MKAFSEEERNNVCYQCLSQGEVNSITIPQMGYGSGFDNWSTKIQLCDNCLTDDKKKWFEFEVIYESDEDGIYGFGKFKYEDEMFHWVSKLDVRVKELFFNTHATESYYLYQPQEWIDRQFNPSSEFEFDDDEIEETDEQRIECLTITLKCAIMGLKKHGVNIKDLISEMDDEN